MANRKRTTTGHINYTAEIRQLRLELQAMQRRYTEDMAAMLARMDRLTPEEAPRIQVPTTTRGRREYWKKQVADW